MTARNPMDGYIILNLTITYFDSFREMMRQRGARGPPKLPRGSFSLGGLILVGGIAIVALNASIFNGTPSFIFISNAWVS
jgi:hypothetical protein